MKKCFPFFLAALFLFGCSNESNLMNRVVGFRSKLLSSTVCEFTASVTLDYGDTAYTYCADCSLDADNNMRLTVLKPSSIAGIKAQISGESGKLTFDDQILAFETTANGLIAPICAPWLITDALRGGYISTCGSENDGMFVCIDDLYKETPIEAQIWFDDALCPVRAEIIWEGKRIVSMEISEFVIL